MDTKGFTMLPRVRISYPHLTERSTYQGQVGKFDGTFLLDKERDADLIAEIKGDMATLLKTELKRSKLPADKLCMRDGDETGKPEYEGHMILKASTDQTPLIVDRYTAKPVAEGENGGIYGGCHVNAKIRLWAQNNGYGQRINANLVAVQFADDGEAFSGSHVAQDDAMDGFAPAADADSFFDEAAA